MKCFTEVAFVKRMQIINITQDILEKGVYISRKNMSSCSSELLLDKM